MAFLKNDKIDETMIFNLLDIRQQRTAISEMETNEISLTVAAAYSLGRGCGSQYTEQELGGHLELMRWSWGSRETRETRIYVFLYKTSSAHTGLGIVPVPIRVEKLIIHGALETSSLQNCARINLYFFKSPGLWCFVMTARTRRIMLLTSNLTVSQNKVQRSLFMGIQK